MEDELTSRHVYAVQQHILSKELLIVGMISGDYYYCWCDTALRHVLRYDSFRFSATFCIFWCWPVPVIKVLFGSGGEKRVKERQP